MNDDSLIGEVTSGIAGEFSKLGKSVTSQITGSTPKDPSSSTAAKQVTGFGKAITGQLFGSKPESTQKAKSTPQPASFLDELKKMGSSVTAQVSGAEDFTAEQVSQMAKKDEEFSKQESDVLRTRIAKVYEEYQAKKKQIDEEIKSKLTQEEQHQKEGEVLMQKNEEASFANPAIAKTRAEIKNYGAERETIDYRTK